MERELWTRHALERSGTLGNNVYYRARRHVDWPDQVIIQRHRIRSVPPKFTTLDEAFSSIQRCLSTTSHSCQNYYRGCMCPSRRDVSHCCRFHGCRDRYSTRISVDADQLNPREDVHMVLPPGSYSVSARNNIDGINQSHVIHVRQGQSVNVDFVL